MRGREEEEEIMQERKMQGNLTSEGLGPLPRCLAFWQEGTTLDTGRRHDSVESNNFMTQGSTRSIITWAPLPSKPPGDDAGGHKWRPHKQGVCLTAEELPSV